MILYGFLGIKIKNTGLHANIHYSSILHIKPIQSTTNITEITEISLNLGISHTKQTQIDVIQHSTSEFLTHCL